MDDRSRNDGQGSGQGRVGTPTQGPPAAVAALAGKETASKTSAPGPSGPGHGDGPKAADPKPAEVAAGAKPKPGDPVASEPQRPGDERERLKAEREAKKKTTTDVAPRDRQ